MYNINTILFILLIGYYYKIITEASFLSDYDFNITNKEINVEQNIYFKNITMDVGRVEPDKRLTMNCSIDLLTTAGQEISFATSVYEIRPDGFEDLFFLTFDLCHALEKDKFVMPFLKRRSNLPSKCPLTPFQLQVENFVFCMKPPFPPMMPEVDFLITYEYFYTGTRKRFAIINLYMKVIPFKY